MSSRPLVWIAVAAAGIVLLLAVTALIGNRDKSGETVDAASWAQSVCGSIGTWRGEMEGIVNSVRQPPSTGTAGVEEPQSETPQGRAVLIRGGLEQSVQATKTLVTGIDNAGVPDSDQGQAAAQQISTWADTSVTNLEKAQDSLDTEAATLEQAVVQLTGAANALRLVLVGGVETLSDVSVLDPGLTAAVHESSTCQQLRQEQSST